MTNDQEWKRTEPNGVRVLRHPCGMTVMASIHVGYLAVGRAGEIPAYVLPHRLAEWLPAGCPLPTEDDLRWLG